MSNSYFSFRQFTVWQDACAMKVCTDACLFGAWIANGEAEDAELQRHGDMAVRVDHVLDIGSGTGLLSLMLAQKSNAVIDAIEVDEPAAVQLKDNLAKSPWHHRMHAITGDAAQCDFGKQYDLIICNPPFYANSLPSPHLPTNKARHDAGLTLESLVRIAIANLAPAGALKILLPHSRSGYFREIAEKAGLSLLTQVDVRQTPKHPYFRSMQHFTRMHTAATFTSMFIRDEHQYSPEFTLLLKDYYLYL